MKDRKYPETSIAISGKILEYKSTEIEIIKAGISDSGDPYVELDPPNAALLKEMCDELEEHGNFTVHLGRPNELILGKSSYPIHG